MIKKLFALAFVLVAGLALVACQPQEQAFEIVSYTTPASGIVTEPETPTRPGYRFAGWFRGKSGLTWLEPEPVKFPYVSKGAETLYAYFEPIDSKAVNYSKGETYYSSITADASLILNPLTYQYSHENDMISNLATSLYTTEVDWDKAIADGVADYVGDFSKIEAKEYSIEALDYRYILVGAARFPYDENGDDFTVDGKFDRTGASQVQRTKWYFQLREDLFFEDGTPIDAYTYEYTLKQYLDPVQNNLRANSYYKDDDNKQGTPIKGASEYFKQTADNPVSWDTVGFKVIDKYTFMIETFEAISQSSAVSFGNIRLVHPEKYAASLTNGANSTYGTPRNPYVSYGPYVIKSWDENQRLVFNKNYDYVRKDTITYKSIVYEVVADVAARMALYRNGGLSGVGLLGEYYEEFAENPNVYRSWDGYPQYLVINYAPSTKAEGAYEKPEITADPRFRQALLFAFNRREYGNTVYAPNTPSLLPIPLDTKAYIQDPLYYSESPNHKRVLEAFDIVEGTDGYLPDRARQLFDAAYNDLGLTGPVTLKFVIDNSDFALSLARWIKNNLETVFNVNGQKLIINIASTTSQAADLAIEEWDFDIALQSVGFGASYGVQWQYGGIGYLGGMLASWSGLQWPFAKDGESVEEFLLEDIEIDLSVTYDYLVSLGEEYIYEENPNYNPDKDDSPYLREGHIMLYEGLQATEDKPEGIYRTTLYELAMLVYAYDTPWDATAQEPFPGATQEVWNVVEAFEMAFFQYAPVIPTVTRSSATLYADNVKILWPDYSSAFGWGANRYRYLSSDPMFADGLYNSYKVAFESSK